MFFSRYNNNPELQNEGKQKHYWLILGISIAAVAILLLLAGGGLVLLYVLRKKKSADKGIYIYAGLDLLSGFLEVEGCLTHVSFR